MDHSDKGEVLVGVPSADEQILFLRRIQRILAEGQFVSTYKFALIHALADLSVVKGDDSGSTLNLSTTEISEKFVELYWQQCLPYAGLVLRQSTGQPASIMTKIAECQKTSGSSMFRFRSSATDWNGLVRSVDNVMREMPLWKLQTVGAEKLEFLYANKKGDTKITLRPGVAFCFRSFYRLIRDLIEAAWIRFVQERNAIDLGQLTDLGTFLFGLERSSLIAYRPILFDIQQGNCLYCGKQLKGFGQVDHFVPWSRYGVDIGQNFVLAHDACNNAKSDYLAAERHLAAWAERNRDHAKEIRERLTASTLPCDDAASIQIAKWIYGQTQSVDGQVWVEKDVLKHLDMDWAKHLRLSA